MDSPHAARHAERADTDASLLAERAKTDAALTKKRSSLQKAEDAVVDLARERAEETLDAARERADREMATAGAAPRVHEKVDLERSAADIAVADERAIADERLRAEREEHRRALHGLLHLEREATDDGLSVERARADQVVSTRDDFLGIVSHDLRNILGSVAMSAAMLTKPGISGVATAAHAERIQRATARMNRLVGDLLDVVSLEAGMLHVTPLPHDAIEVAKEAFETFLPSFLAKEVTLTTDTGEGLLVAQFDHDRILQVVANLLSNALKFTERGGHVTLSLARVGSEVRFLVTDTGIGIPADKRDIIFERFGQVTRDRPGRGLGLYIARCIVEAHGGRIWVESPKAGGSALHFTLPAASDDRAWQAEASGM
jgi:signal transduction histidine kinase